MTSPANVDPSAPAGYPRKRARTRQRLVRAAMAALHGTSPEAVTVKQVASLAGTSTGTVYNHVSSVEALMEELADQLIGGVAIAPSARAIVGDDPAARVAVGCFQLLRLADADPTAATAFVSLVALRPEFRSRVRHIVGTAIDDGVNSRRFDVTAGPAPVNAVLGTCLQSMRSRVLGESTTGDHREVVSLVLRTLGVDGGDASSVIERVADQVDLDAWLPDLG